MAVNYCFTTEPRRPSFLSRWSLLLRRIRRWIGEEFINGYERWCLWLGDCPPAKLRAMPEAS
jgi:hypothetical protein